MTPVIRFIIKSKIELLEEKDLTQNCCSETNFKLQLYFKV